MKLQLLAAALAAVSVQALAHGDLGVRRNQSGSINYAPLPAVYVVLAVDDYASTLTLLARNGATAEVEVSERGFDVSKLEPGDLVRVDFLVPNEYGDEDEPLTAATIWPLR